jgi:hypothetical protein
VLSAQSLQTHQRVIAMSILNRSQTRMGGEKDAEEKNVSGESKTKNRLQKENMYPFLSASQYCEK